MEFLLYPFCTRMVPKVVELEVAITPLQVFNFISSFRKDIKCHVTNKKEYLPAKPGKHAVPPDKTIVLYQSLSHAKSAEWQCSTQRAMAWCRPIACLNQKMSATQAFTEYIKQTNKKGKKTNIVTTLCPVTCSVVRVAY